MSPSAWQLHDIPTYEKVPFNVLFQTNLVREPSLSIKIEVMYKASSFSGNPLLIDTHS